MFKSDTVILPLAIITSLFLHIFILPEVFSTQALLGAISPSKSNWTEDGLRPSMATGNVASRVLGGIASVTKERL